MSASSIARPSSPLRDSVRAKESVTTETGQPARKQSGLTISRRFTRTGDDPFESVRWDRRTSRIRDESGNVIFEANDAEVPADWSQVATDIVVSKYFRRAGVPQTNADGSPIVGPDGKPVLGGEQSVRQVIGRLTTCWRWWGEQHGYFASPEDAKTFEAELQYMLVRQMAAPNSPQWFNTGLHLSYGITGPAQGHYYVDPKTEVLMESTDAYSHPQPHACFIQSVKDSLLESGGIMDLMTREARVFKYGSGTGSNFSALREAGAPLSGGGASSGLMSWLRIFDRAAGAIKSGGTTRRAAKMVILNADHPDIEEFIWWKANEEKKVAALVAAGYPSDFNGEAYQTVSGQNSNNTVRVPNTFLEAVENDGDWNLESRVPGRGVVKTLKARKLWNGIAEAAWLSADPGLQYDTTIQEWHTCPASGRINATNPCCVTGDTLVAVADGRNAVAIKDLAGTEVSVYAWDHGRARTTISRMWNIGVKRSGVPVSRVTLDDGSSFRATDDHLIMLRDGTYRQVKDLNAGDSLMPFHSRVRQNVDWRTPRRFVSTGKGWRVQYRWLWEYVHGKQPAGFHLHHRNFNSLDDRLKNLALISEQEHAALHRDRMLGDRNPARRLMNDMWREHIADAVRGERNPHYGRPHTNAARAQMRAASARRWENPVARRHASEAARAWMADAHTEGRRIGRLPHPCVTRSCPVCRNTFTVAREGQVFCSLTCRMSLLGLQMVGVKHGATIRGRHLSNEHRAKIRAAGILAAKPEHKRRAQRESLRIRCLRAAHAALRAGISLDLTRWEDLRGGIRRLGVPHVPSQHTMRMFFHSQTELEEAADTYNHCVVSIARDGVEDVYDGTVDGHHNFGIVTSAVTAAHGRGAQDFSGIFIHNSEYVFLDDTACNLASINLMKFVDEETGAFDVEGYVHAIRLWTTVLEISVLMAQFPSKEIAKRSYEFRTLGLGYANLGTLLMVWGIPYDSPEARAIAGALTAILTGESYAMSGRMARHFGSFPAFRENREHMLRVMRNHRRAAYAAPVEKYEGLTITPMPIDQDVCPANLLKAAHTAWDSALSLGEKYGYRNAQVTVIAPTGTIGLLMDCDTTGVEPDFALVKFKKLAGGGYFKIVNQSVPHALRKLGYTSEQIHDIVRYVSGTLSFSRAPFVSRAALQDRGFLDDDIARVEKQLPGTFSLSMAFTPKTLGPELLRRIGCAEKAAAQPFLNVLQELGFSEQEINTANEEICGRMTIEGAPHLKAEHYAVFDCANKCGEKGTRCIASEGHIRMVGATQPFVSGSLSKTINMPTEATLEDVERAYMLGWKLGLKANALYRDGSKLSQPLSTKLSRSDSKVVEKVVEKVIERIVEKPRRNKLPRERQAVTRKVNLGGQEFYATVGMYPDGTAGELFITMSQEGTFVSGMADAFAKMVSIALQYGVPLENVIRQLRHMRFAPDGFTGDPDIPTSSSVVDFLAQWLEKSFVGGHHTAATAHLPFPEGDKTSSPSAPSVKEETEEETNGSDDENGGPIAFHPAPGVVMTVAKPSLSQASQEIPTGLGFTGDKCPDCSSLRMVQNGTCKKCLDCGATTGCS